MRRFPIAFVILLAGSSYTYAASPALPPGSSVKGVPLQEVVAEWARWFMPTVQAAGKSGTSQGAGASSCVKSPSGTVWFLSAAASEDAPPRTCAIREGEDVLVPVFALAASTGKVAPSGCSILQSALGSTVANVSELELTVNAEAVPDIGKYRAQTESCFSFGKDYIGFADGYWVVLSLPKGQHSVRARSAQKVQGKNSVSQKVDYDITVE